LFARAAYLLAVVLAWPDRNATAAVCVLAGYLGLIVLVQLAEHRPASPWAGGQSKGRRPRTRGSRPSPGREQPPPAG